MSLIVEDGTGLSNAESYLAVADADTYHANYGNTTWTSATTTEKEIALRKATRALDGKFGSRWKGYKAHNTQRLDWPRAGVEIEGYHQASTLVPQELKDATAEMSLRALTEDVMPDVTNPGTIKKTRVKVGPIEDEVEYAGGAGYLTRYTVIDAMLDPLITAIGTLERG